MSNGMFRGVALVVLTIALVRLGSDPNERSDLAGEQEERVSQLRQVMETWHRPTGSVAQAD